MKYLISVFAIAAFIFSSVDASALIAEARAMSLCTDVDYDDHTCTDGYYFPKSGSGDGTLTEIVDNCDWTAGSCEVWAPDGWFSADDIYGVRGTCCFQAQTGESNLLWHFAYYDHSPAGWSYAMDVEAGPATESGSEDICTSTDYAYLGTEVDDLTSGYSYSTASRVLRCIAQVTVTGGFVKKGFEYWMDAN